MSKISTQPLLPFLCLSSRMNGSISRHYTTLFCTISIENMLLPVLLVATRAGWFWQHLTHRTKLRRVVWRGCVLSTEMAMRCDAKILAMRVLAAKILCDALPRCENTGDAGPHASHQTTEGCVGIPEGGWLMSWHVGAPAPYLLDG